jgi:hypothetical protein
MSDPLERIALALDEQIAHVWMVRTFLKHSEEAEEDEDLCDVHRTLYDYMHALGAPRENRDWPALFKLAKKKYAKLRKATELWEEVQPEISGHTSFQMSKASLVAAVRRIGELLDEVAAQNPASAPKQPIGGVASASPAAGESPAEDSGADGSAAD